MGVNIVSTELLLSSLSLHYGQRKWMVAFKAKSPFLAADFSSNFLLKTPGK